MRVQTRATRTLHRAVRPAAGIASRGWSPYGASADHAHVAGGGHDLARIAVSAPAAGAPLQRVRASGGPSPQGGVIQRVQGRLKLGELFPKADPKKIKDYSRISDMLENSGRVQGHLEELNAAMKKHGDLESALNVMEKENKFEAPVDVSALLSEQQFMAHVARGHQLVDPGARLQHGPLTHRIQWWMVQNEVKKAKEKGEDFHHSAIDLYKGLAEPEFRFHNNVSGGETNTGWDALFDRVRTENVDRASRPEWLHPQMLDKGGEKQVLDTSRFPDLNAELNKRYTVAHDASKGSEGMNEWEAKSSFFDVDTPRGMIDAKDDKFSDELRGKFNQELQRQDVITSKAERVRASSAHSYGPLPDEEPIGSAAVTREKARKSRLEKEASQQEQESVPELKQSQKEEEKDDPLPFFD